MIAFAVTAVVMVAAFALAARRLLGLRFGTVRTLLGAALAVLLFGPVSQALVGR